MWEDFFVWLENESSQTRETYCCHLYNRDSDSWHSTVFRTEWNIKHHRNVLHYVFSMHSCSIEQQTRIEMRTYWHDARAERNDWKNWSCLIKLHLSSSIRCIRTAFSRHQEDRFLLGFANLASPLSTASWSYESTSESSSDFFSSHLSSSPSI